MRTKKHLGQHFLTSKKALADIIAAADVMSTDTILEIGPGKGILTRALLARAGKVIAVEKDEELINILHEKFANEIKNGQLILKQEDILSCDLKTLLDAPYKIVANIPYYITGEILRVFLSLNKQPQSMALLIQKEVAERIVARDKKESVLSLSVKVYGTPRIISKVPKRYFSPQPKVDSAILTIENISKDFFNTKDEGLFFKVIHTGFAHKRKLLIRNLETLFSRETLQRMFLSCTIAENIRAEDLTLKEWGCIADYRLN